MGRSSMQDLLIRIDLSNRMAAPWSVPEQLKGYIGGMGYGTKILVDEVPPQTDPLFPENKLILTVGPLTGTTAPMHPQSCIVTKSPPPNGLFC
jgi:aldehyde:ferredoxin oxidoreductase